MDPLPGNGEFVHVIQPLLEPPLLGVPLLLIVTLPLRLRVPAEESEPLLLIVSAAAPPNGLIPQQPLVTAAVLKLISVLVDWTVPLFVKLAALMSTVPADTLDPAPIVILLAASTSVALAAVAAIAALAAVKRLPVPLPTAILAAEIEPRVRLLFVAPTLNVFVAEPAIVPAIVF